MDKNTFKEFIESVAEIEYLTPKRSPSIRQDADDVNQVRVDDQWIDVNLDNNPTLGFQLVKLKPVYRTCELNCGAQVPNQVIEQRMNFYPVIHWRVKCINCNKYAHPSGEGMIEVNNVGNVYIKYHKDQTK